MTQKKGYTRTIPFTQQTWQVTHNAKNMNGSSSAPKSHDDATTTAPPQKRRRLSASKPLHDTSVPSETERHSSLRIEIHKLFHKDSKRVRPLQETPPNDEILNTKGKCQITISDVSGGFINIVHRVSQSCDIVSYKNPSGPHRIIFIKPLKSFVVPEETILINRQDDPSHDFSSSYKLDVELSSINDGSWPPLNAQELGFTESQPQPKPLADAGEQKWVLHSEFPQIFGRCKNPVKLTAGVHPERPECHTDYVMDINLRWATAFKPIDKTANSCITAVDPDAEEIYTSDILEPIPDDQLDSVSPLAVEDGVNVVGDTGETNEINGVSETEGVGEIHGINETNGIKEVGIANTHESDGIKEAEIANEHETNGIKEAGIANEHEMNGIKGAGIVNEHETNGVNGIHHITPEPESEPDSANGILDTSVVNEYRHLSEDLPHAHSRDHSRDHSQDHSQDHSHDLEDELEGDQTPNRPLRKRANHVNYNLKKLSAQASGKERKPRAKAGQNAQVEGRVTYLPPINDPVHLDSWRCFSCGCPNDSLDVLRAHLKNFHLNYDYALEITSEGPLFRVTRISGLADSPTKTLQLGKPTGPFNLKDYNKGNESWITSRLGPDHSEPDVLSPAKATTKKLSDKPAIKPPQPLPAAQTVERRQEKKKVIIPDSSQPLFDPTSKARLKPGDELPKPAVDNKWLLQKHREGIGEFSDVSPEEKEYICRWDAFMLQQNVTSRAYFRRSWLKFVKDNALWLASVGHRMIEFGKHLCVLMAKDVLDDQCVDSAYRLIEDARTQLKSGGCDEEMVNIRTAPGDSPSKQLPRTSHITKGANGCTICKLPVLGPSLLICSNKVIHVLP